MSPSSADFDHRHPSPEVPAEQPSTVQAHPAAPTGKMDVMLSEAGEFDPSDHSVGDPVTRKTRLLSRKCDTCIYHPGNPMHLSPGRLKDITDEARTAESYIICHETTPHGRMSRAVRPAVCRGFFDRFTTNSLRVIGRLFGFLLVDPASWATPNPTSADDSAALHRLPDPDPVVEPTPRRIQGPTQVRTGAVIAIDVDGVLCPTARRDDAMLPEAGYQQIALTMPDTDGNTRTGWVWINPEHGARLAALADGGAELVWATSWGHKAAKYLAPVLGLPDMAVLDIGSDTSPRFGWSPKIGPIRAYAADRPLAWLDDVFGGREADWAQERSTTTPTLLIATTAHQGLTTEHLEAVTAWLYAQTDAADADTQPDITRRDGHG
ncbi:HAD domain-containing protein [Longispora sp. K20-0274]|uniref:HAD domain-containing protein n=1 Tax=Longispora sp. K20-0274 TaxID=3088255 RepID=UPI00399B4B51